MKILRNVHGCSMEFDLSREELQKAYQEYDELVLREQVEWFLRDKKGVISLDAYSGVIDTCVKTCRQEMSTGKSKATALLDSINAHFKYMEQTPTGLVELQPGFFCIDNLLKSPGRVCFCPEGVPLSKENSGYTGKDFFEIADQNGFLAQALFQYCVEHPDMTPGNASFLPEVHELARRMEADDRFHARDVAIQRKIQQDRAIDFYNAISEQFGGEGDALSIALTIHQLLQACKDLPDGLSPSDAGILSDRIFNLSLQPDTPSKDDCISSVSDLLHYGMDMNRCPLLPQMSPQDTKTLLMECSMDAFRSAVCTYHISVQNGASEYCPLEDPALDVLVKESRRFSDMAKQTLDVQLSGARMRKGTEYDPFCY